MEMSMVVWLLVAALAAVFFFTSRGRNGSATGSATVNNLSMSMVVWLLVAALAAVFFFTSRGRNGSATGSATVNNLSAQKVYTKSEVAWHNKRTDCWIIIKDKVYDVTSYVEEHPGGDSILAHAGDDSTEGFYGPQHATRVFDMVDEFYIGDLKQ